MPVRILAVEDSPTQAEALKVLLEGEGYAVGLAASGEEALRTLGEQPADLVVADILMPGMDGYELCRRIKADRTLRELPVVLLTSLGDPLDIARGLECGADNYIIKPYEPTQLSGRLRHVLDSRMLRRKAVTRVGIQVSFLGRTFTITSDREQILDLLISTFEDVVRTNEKLQTSQAELADANAQLEAYARRMAVQARVSVEKYWTLMEHAVDAIFVLDHEGKILEGNPRAARLVGATLDDLLGRRFEELVVPDEVEYLRVQFARLPAVRRLQATDVHVRLTAGQPVCVDIVASLVTRDTETLVLAIVRDVTQRKKLEGRILEQERLATIGQLAAGVAHEINNPMSYLLANLEQMEGMITGAGPDSAAPDLQSCLRDALDGAKRIRDIVRDLKTFAHADDESLARVNVKAAVESAINIAYNQIKHRVRLERDLADVPDIVANPGRVTQVVLNLLVNAVQALEGHDPTSQWIRVASRREGEWIRIEVADSGSGIPEELLPTVFEPFVTTKPPGVGTGLGLSISRGIVRDLRGDITVASAPDRGTVFTVMLPLDTGKQLAPVVIPEPVQPASYELLLVDDEPNLLRAYARILGQRHKPTTALGGRQAIEVLERMGPRFDAIVCDLLMPDVDGVDLHGWVKEHQPGLEQHMVFVTGGAATLRAREFLAALPTPWVEKPFEMDELLRRVNEVARGSAV